MEHGSPSGLSPEDRRFIYEELPRAIVDADCRQVSPAFKTMVARASAVAISLIGTAALGDIVGLIPGILIYSAAMGAFFHMDRRLTRRAQEEAEGARACRFMKYEDFDLTPKDR